MSNLLLVSLHRVREAWATSLLVALDEHDDVDVEGTSGKEVTCGTGSREDGTLIVRDTATVQIAIATFECEWICRPASLRRIDDIVVTVEWLVLDDLDGAILPIEQDPRPWAVATTRPAEGC